MCDSQPVLPSGLLKRRTKDCILRSEVRDQTSGAFLSFSLLSHSTCVILGFRGLPDDLPACAVVEDVSSISAAWSASTDPASTFMEVDWRWT